MKQKNLVFFSLFSVLSLFYSCSVVPIWISIQSEGKSVVQKGTVVEALLENFGFNQFASFDISQSQEFKEKRAEKKYVSEALIKMIELKISSPDSQNFNFLEEIQFFIESPGKEKKRVAFKRVPRDVTVFSCDLDKIDIAEYVKSDTFTVTTTAKGRRPSKETEITAKLILDVAVALY